MQYQVLPREFYERDTEIVARELLGKRLIRRLDDDLLEGIVVETEAYYGLNDPASRAFNGMKEYNQLMWKDPGKTFIYNVHQYWMFNIVAHEPNKIGGVLIRAIEPTKGIDVMRRNRPVSNTFNLTSGPGKLTISLAINKNLNGISVTSEESTIFICDNTVECNIACSQRIGVKKDLKRELRFYIEENKFVSR